MAARGSNAFRLTLTTSELMGAAHVGVMRQVASIKQGLHTAYGQESQRAWEDHIVGAIGERVVAKLLGIYWDGSVNTFRNGGDVGPYQVRLRSRPEYQLNIRKNDKPAAIFILVRGSGLSYEVPGWIRARDAQARPEWLRDYGNRGHAAYFVPDAELQPIWDLPPGGHDGLR